MSATNRSCGSLTSVSFNRTNNFKPGTFSANPFLRSTQENMSFPGESLIPFYRTDYGLTWMDAYHEGDLRLRTGTALIGPTPSLPSSSSSLSRAIIKAVGKSTAPVVDLSVNAFELASTVKLLASPVRSLIPLVRKLVRPKTFPRSKKWFPGSPFSYASTKWLEYRYGIMPLIGDIENTRKLVDNGMNTDNRLRSKRSKDFTSTSSETLKGTLWDPTNTIQFQYVQTTETTGFYYCIYYFRVIDSIAYNQSRLGINALNILGTAWELVPFSFVADWFIGVGDWLSYIRPKPELQSIGLVTGRGTNVKVTRSVNSAKLSNGFSTPISHTTKAERFNFERFPPSTSLPHLLPQVNEGIHNLNRSLDSISLLWQQLPKSILKK